MYYITIVYQVSFIQNDESINSKKWKLIYQIMFINILNNCEEEEEEKQKRTN